MKVCSKCKEKKELDQFNKNKSCIDGLQAQCKECKNIGNNIYVKNNYDKYRKYHKDKYDRNYKYISEFKTSCIKCNENRFWVLDFHHLNPNEKEKGISELLSHSLQKIKNEISKCIILCRNCHSDFHYLEKRDNINIEDYLK